MFMKLNENIYQRTGVCKKNYQIKILELTYTITNIKKLNKAYQMPQKRVLVKWKTSQLKKKTYMKAEIKKKSI